MRHKFHYQGRVFIEDSEIQKTHVVFGQRDEFAARPFPEKDGEMIILDPKKNPEDYAKQCDYVFKVTHGYFALKALAWATSEEEAKQLSARFTAPEWINVRVVEVDPEDTIIHA